MFHVKVRNSAGHTISATRWEMFFAPSIVDCMPIEKMTPQEMWTEYCRRHRLAFGRDFQPDVNDDKY